MSAMDYKLEGSRAWWNAAYREWGRHERRTNRHFNRSVRGTATKPSWRDPVQRYEGCLPKAHGSVTP